MCYEKMYAVLCSACSEAMDALDRSSPAEARAILQKAILQAEDMYISGDEDEPEDSDL